MSLTLASLFDGIGVFPLAASRHGIRPVWASEIEKAPISITKRHFPEMVHMGNITELHGANLPPVDIISFGSPCQGLSMAGKRLGLADERSGLFSEAVRIINEMREATDGKYPRYALWENVPGALSSGTPRGSDFRAVLEAFTKTSIPVPQSGRWANAGMVRSAGVDLAWVIYDAQRFGTAQRRRRIFLVVDFGGKSAGEILLVPQSLRGYFAAGGTPRQGPAAYAAGGAERADGGGREDGAPFVGDALPAIAMRIRQGCEGGGKGPLLQTERSGTLATGNDQTLFSPCLNPWDTQNTRVMPEDGIAPTLAGADGGGGRNPGGLVLTGPPEDSLVCLNDQGGQRMDVEKGAQAPTLRSVTKGNLPVICAATTQVNAEIYTELCPTITEAAGTSGNNKPYIICRATALANAETLVDKSATLTCYLIPYVAYSVSSLLGIRLPEFLTTGLVGIMKCMAFAFLVVGITWLLGKYRIKLKI